MNGSTLALEMLAWFQLMALIIGFVAACAYLGERNGQIDQNSRAIGKLTSAVDDLVKAQADMSESIAGNQRAVEGVIRRLDDVVRATHSDVAHANANADYDAAVALWATR